MRTLVVETAPFGGLLHYAVQLADALAEHGDAVDLLVTDGNELQARPGAARRLPLLPAGPGPPRGSAGRLTTVARRARTAAWRLATWRRIVAVARRGSYDAVLLNGSIDLSLTALGAWTLIGAGGAPVAHVCHNVRPFNRWGGDDLFVSSPLLLGLLRRVYPAFALVLVHGARSRAAFEEAWPGAHLAEVQHGDEGLFATRAGAPPPSHEPRALFFGDWRRVKGLPVLMEAFDRLLAAHPEVRLTIAGSPSEEEGGAAAVLAWAAGRAPIEVLPGYVPVDDVEALFGRARVVVAPYLVGYQSGVVHLAMTLGRAVVASDVGDLGSAVSDGVTGALVPAGDPAALATALGGLLADPERAGRFGAAGRERVAARSAWPLVAATVAAELEAIAARGGHRRPRVDRPPTLSRSVAPGPGPPTGRSRGANVSSE